MVLSTEWLAPPADLIVNVAGLAEFAKARDGCADAHSMRSAGLAATFPALRGGPEPAMTA